METLGMVVLGRVHVMTYCWCPLVPTCFNYYWNFFLHFVTGSKHLILSQVCGAADLRSFGMFATTVYRRYMSKVQSAYSTIVTTTVKSTCIYSIWVKKEMNLQAELKEQEAVPLTGEFWRSAFKQLHHCNSTLHRYKLDQKGILCTW